MAELRDSLNQVVLHINFEKQESERLISNVKLVFQKQVFVNNDVGWIDEIQAEICWYKLALVRSEVDSFIRAAQTWTELFLSELAETFFTGCWSLGSNYSTERFDIEFKPLHHSPSKTDGFTIRVDICTDIWKTQEFHSDYTSLVNFIDDLKASYSSAPKF